MAKTLFDKIWDAHAVTDIEGGPTQLYIDRQFAHEVTSPQAFNGLRERGLEVLRPSKTTATPDHNIPTWDQDKPIADPISKFQVETLTKNCNEFGITLYGLGNNKNGIVHVVGPENGYTLPGMTIVCGDSHTSTHGAFGTIAFGIGTSEVEMVLASQCILQPRPKTMLINIDGELGKAVSAKDIILYVISQLSTGGGTGHFVEFAGSAITALSMEARMTLCNMSIEMGARGGLIAPDQTTFDYIEGREFAPKGDDWDKAIAYWKTLKTDDGAKFDKVFNFNAKDIEPMITYGTNPGMGVGISGSIPTLDEIDKASQATFKQSMDYMGFQPGDKMIGKKIDYVFVGSCTNGRIEDLRTFCDFIKGKKKADHVTAWIVPGSRQVEKQAREEGLIKIMTDAGFVMRQPGCSACLAMNDDKIPAGKYSVSTSNRNFEGRQGPGARTLLASVLTAAAAAITGEVTDPRTMTESPEPALV
ncbi:3-isopropylmalate dehydratase large subunit [Verrucomicrobiaceae bacterium 5K15]|uniref:3-isopropylmalate dehydratase large subunit n=1 Tax=Oceaniferula flava TaxID=2800421 RepID=A0AAE2V991_9BACT|nr:3-isopropylmalate dehydratase large subunit [Oceaniferula flavus]MBK1854728.1 3-isopropylmalate dehydratase large subunit [Oceaniferula flavus]MBM1136034.1 3-isopropylmalate dehydratase large subunit [Oceaniferula flavus]